MNVRTHARTTLGAGLLVIALATTTGGCKKSTPAAATPAATVSDSAPAAATNAPTSAAPSSAAPTSPGSAIDGDWNGTWSSTVTPGDTGTFTVTYSTSPSGALTGRIHINDTPCVSDGTVTGTIHGNDITFGAVHGAQEIAFTGTLSGDTMSGSYDSPSCGHGKGTWTSTRA